MLLAFTLTMPGRNTWNGRWSGEEKLYVKVEKFGDSKAAKARVDAILRNAPYSHSWDDGWRARIEVEEVDSAKARKLRKQSAGFCGYDWMVENIKWYQSTEKPENHSVS